VFSIFRISFDLEKETEKKIRKEISTDYWRERNKSTLK
jgi:hypothetical protein